MTKGANVALATLSENTGSVTISLEWSSPNGDGDADVSVLLLGADGKVRSNADFFFYNNPAAANGSVQLLGQTPTGNGNEDRIQLDLTALPSDVERAVVAASRHQRAAFGQLENLRITLTDAGGERLLGFSISGASMESAFVFGEMYRRNDEWKFRAVGQGYETGLAGLATDYGIEIDDDDEQDAEAPQAEPEGKKEREDVSGAAPPASAGVPAPRPAGPVVDAPAADVPVIATAEAGPATAAAGRRLRTARKKVTLPKAPRKSLAENDSWRSARLFPASSLKNDREREIRATSILLSVMAHVPEFGRRLTAGFGAPSGHIETFTEVTLPNGDSPRRPDGIIRIERAGKLWTALVETKTNGNPLKAQQVQDYMDIAARRGYEAVITLSNDVALEGSPLVLVKVDGRRKHKVALWHLSWAEVTHQAQMLIRHEGVRNEIRAWMLQELLQYLQHENSGCHGFQNMGPAWVPVRNGIDQETLCPGDQRAVLVVESWERLIRQVCLRLGGELGEKVMPVQRARRGTDPQSRRTALAERFCEDGRLHAEIRIDGAAGVLAVTADLRLGKLRTSIDVAAPDQVYPLSRVKRLLKQLVEAPADLHVQTLLDGQGAGPRGTLEKLRPEPGDLVPRNAGQISGFRLSLSKSVGSTRGNAESGFIRSVDDAVDRFYSSVIVHLEAWAGRRSPEGAPA
ncbi:stress response protein TerZ [Streptomyces agglomeratus]|uniref:TerD family protein n=1 Tax=Streptomyces agglomeratus TaxID=285458 RepID=UPI00086F75CA|nr:TerD family protein [Streptomyces agglomeratus]OEJ58447.1 stress response protein TerZ [Streptomyces agglomeratus]